MRLAIIGAAGQIPGFLIPRVLEETDFKLTLVNVCLIRMTAFAMWMGICPVLIMFDKL